MAEHLATDHFNTFLSEKCLHPTNGIFGIMIQKESIRMLGGISQNGAFPEAESHGVQEHHINVQKLCVPSINDKRAPFSPQE